jgi:hypothetical protein
MLLYLLIFMLERAKEGELGIDAQITPISILIPAHITMGIY